jgi:polyribonucleotide 5'-hydroxyl-kinase
VNIILVLGSERLYSEMQKRFSSYTGSDGQPLTFVKLDKSGGCVDRDDTFMQQSREVAIREYFHGDSKRILSPHTQYVGFDEVVVYKIHDRKLSSPLPSAIS